MASVEDAASSLRTLSERGKRATVPALSYLEAFLDGLGNQYDSENNPDGVICLCVAENKLSEPEVQELFGLRAEASPMALDESILYYNDMTGIPEFKEKVATLLTSSLKLNSAVDPNHVCCSSGTGAILETLAWNLCDDGDGILIPAPYYPAFDNDLCVKAGCQIFPCPMESAKGVFRLTESILNQGYEKAITRGSMPRVLLLTNPNNPTGTTMEMENILMCLKWAMERSIHVISDEIYARTVYIPGEGAPFISAMTVIENACGGNKELQEWAVNHLHVVYGLSKDFCVSGLRAGFLYSKNLSVMGALNNLNYFHAMSGYAQMHLLKGFLSSPEKIEAYTLVNNDRIFRSARCLFGLLNDLGIDYIHPNSGIFLFVDMSSLFSIHTFEGEQKLHRKLYEKCGVLFTPGQDCHCPKPGWFRVCFAWVPLTALKTAFEKIADSIDFLKA